MASVEPLEADNALEHGLALPRLVLFPAAAVHSEEILPVLVLLVLRVLRVVQSTRLCKSSVPAVAAEVAFPVQFDDVVILVTSKAAGETEAALSGRG